MPRHPTGAAITRANVLLMKTEHYWLIGALIVFAVLLYANRSCPGCKAKQAMISGYDVWPGAGPGVATASGYSAPA